jgi:hypothetical protein
MANALPRGAGEVADEERAAVRSPAMSRSGTAAVGSLAIALACLASSVGAVAEPSRSVLKYRNDRLSVRLVEVPLEEIIADLGQASGADVYGTVRQSRDVSAEFDDVPLVEALQRLLGDQNFVLKYGRGDRLRAIKLLGGPQAHVRMVAAPAPPPDLPAGASKVPWPRDPGGAVAMLDGHPAVPISGRLAQALGTDAATFRQLFDAAAHNEDAAVRSEAMRAFMRGLDAEPEFRELVLRALNTLDDFTLTELLHGLAGSRATEIAAEIAAHAHSSELRSRARGIVLRLGGARDATNEAGTRLAG